MRGPEALTGRDRIRIIDSETGRQFSGASLTPAEVHEDSRQAGYSESDIACMNAIRTTPPCGSLGATRHRVTHHEPPATPPW